MSTCPFTYTAYGLTIHSEVECPELLPATGTVPDDGLIRIAYGSVPAYLNEPVDMVSFFQARPNAFLLRLEGVAAYMVEGGQNIVVEPAAGATDDEVRLFLLGSAFGALLHQRGLLVLHASAIETPDGAVLFTGPSGNGKSTLAVAFRQRGYRMIADDVCALYGTGCPDRGLRVLPAYPQAKLWAHAASRLSIDPHRHRRVRPQDEKYAVPIGAGFSDAPLPLRAIYLLELHDRDIIDLVPVADARKVGVLLQQTYREQFLDGLAMRVEHFDLVAAAANAARVMRARRPSRAFLLEELVQVVEADFLNETV